MPRPLLAALDRLEAGVGTAKLATATASYRLSASFPFTTDVVALAMDRS